MTTNQRLDEIEKWAMEMRGLANRGSPLDWQVCDTVTLVAALRAVLALHHPVDITFRSRVPHRKSTLRVIQQCAECTDTGDPYQTVSDEWPCPTVTALTEQLEALL